MKTELMKAQAFTWGAMSSLGNADNMLMRQFQFPAEFDPTMDKFVSADSDRLLGWDYHGFRKILMKYIGKGEMAIGSWVRQEGEYKTEVYNGRDGE